MCTMDMLEVKRKKIIVIIFQKLHKKLSNY